MLKDDFIISITGTQKYEQEEDGKVSVDTFGSYIMRNGIRFITYKEYDDENLQISRTAVVKVEGDRRVTMMKAGTGTRLILEKGKRHSCIYNTHYGTLSLGVYTSDLTSTLDDDGGELTVNYTLDINTSMSSENTVHLTVKRAQKQQNI
jgi:uncharacterized beta-barrel protein YwiB (DUF1934 family)